ncbi:similar to Saccharomyces cerevisiae YDR197W CBS2 Mitochondrial translational activator of the COB mRNA [Maudiozyma barnettii]|uniref:Similar to Saccharomyces cerevisiae YDR197W CBS2 Mitochondrial translational activator of the COB mRNA n=1 Tax=Maudiozyma barnettii TaxID=61262 RepID=A0A8H2VGE6_9SACH|nr:Cbs2p [Kazachstania barnettii]CAB4255000.1 similar to Saccharomyces cerevisiae YDR197W CBS2 Mitochondrial translational activator of the COB mRNA [Kazachstania barnettii]CAD1783271.1 similar to Saccharomyces cerevisiae YDR197W CBS2 Mitochondrial translational activator of the COB mRNA [Kazachstania barnettii]
MTTVPRVYVLGNSLLSNYFAYEIAQLKAQQSIPNIVLLLNDQKKLNRFLDGSSKLTKGGTTEESIQFMAACSPPTFASGKPAIMENLILADNSKKNISHLITKYHNSLDETSNVLLLNPPVGSIEYLYDKIMTRDKYPRPHMLLGMTKQGDSTVSLINNKRTNYIPYSEFEVSPILSDRKLSVLLCSVPESYNTFDLSLETTQVKDLYKNKLVNLLQDTQNISVQILSYSELMIIRFENLIVNSCIESLAVLFDCKYIHELLNAPRSESILRSLIQEQVKIISMGYPFLTELPHYDIAFDNGRLYDIIANKLEQGKRTKSVLNIQQKALNQTDIKQLTGYFVRLAYKCKTDCRWNMTISWLIECKVELQKARALDYHYL